MLMMRCLLLVILQILAPLSITSAFLLKVPSASSRNTRQTVAAALPRNDSDEDDAVEQQRQQLESLLGSAIESTVNKSFLNLPYSKWHTQLSKTPHPALTAVGRQRLEMEIRLLESLVESDAAISQLWNLWYNARGPGPAKDLLTTEALVAQGHPDAWQKAEDLLRKLIAQEGLYWAEPVNRLATLLFLQARYEESKELCKLVLQVKPWHFGALSGIVLVCQGLNDAPGMAEWAQKRMPPLLEDPSKNPSTKRRQEWVDEMLDLAKANLLKGEMGLEEAFQGCDEEELETEKPKDEEQDAWQ